MYFFTIKSKKSLEYTIEHCSSLVTLSLISKLKLYVYRKVHKLRPITYYSKLYYCSIFHLSMEFSLRATGFRKF